MNTNKFCVIMVGGVGSRFWPISREEKPKQFLDVLGVGSTLLQTTYRRFSKIIPQENILVVTNVSYASLVREQLPQLSDEALLLEPIRRNTVPMATYATYRIHQKNPDAVVVVTPCDHWVEDEDALLASLEKGLNIVENNNILLSFGIKPTHPETAYGYIQADEHEIAEGVSRIKTFTEKPSIDIARLFFESGEFLWNSGLFFWNVKTFIVSLHEMFSDMAMRFEAGKQTLGTDTEKKFIKEVYPYLPNMALDFGLMEKATNGYVLAGNFRWCDLGTWGALHKVMPKDENANVVQAGEAVLYDSSNNMVAVSPQKLVLLQGVEDLVIVETDDVLMICKRGEEQRTKQFVADVKLRFGEKFI